jgi:hypothetical protein
MRGTPSCFPNSSADDYQLQSLLLIYFILWLLIFEEQGPACSVGNIASLTCSVVAEPNLGVICLLLTSAVLNTDWVEKMRGLWHMNMCSGLLLTGLEIVV